MKRWKRPIVAMATPKKQAIDRAGFYANQITEHTIKIVLYHDIRKNEVQHWIKEIATWLADVDKIKLKDNKKLKPQDIENATFGWMGTELHDYLSILNKFQRDNSLGKFNYKDLGQYPEVNITYDLAVELMDVSNEMISVVIPMLCDKKDHSVQEYVATLNEVFYNYV